MQYMINISKKLLTIVAMTMTMATNSVAADTLTVAMTGDIMMGTLFPTPVLPSEDGKKLFVDVKDILLNADVTAGNLEGTLCDDGTTKKKPSKYCYAFETPLRFAPRLKEVGFDFLTMANNHSMDFGLKGLESTEKTLDAMGIAYAGVRGRRKGAVVTRNGVRYGFCAFGHNGYTIRHQELETAKAIIDSIRNKCDILIVTFHGGAEGKDKSNLPQGREYFLGEDRGGLRSFTHFCIDNGADIVFGHGPHVVRCVELYKGRLIAYSLGNFCTPYGVNITGISGYAPVLEAKISKDGRFLKGKIHSFIQQRGKGPRKDNANMVAKQMRKLTNADIKNNKLKIADDGTITVK